VISKLEIRKSKLEFAAAGMCAKPVSSLRALRNDVRRKKTQTTTPRRQGWRRPASRISRPGAKRSIEPAERKHCKKPPDDFVKKLLERAPNARNRLVFAAQRCGLLPWT